MAILVISRDGELPQLLKCVNKIEAQLAVKKYARSEDHFVVDTDDCTTLLVDENSVLSWQTLEVIGS